jgi:two-component system chemotaxis response regulator CheY
MGKAKRILTVDDSRVFRSILSHSLSSGGYEVVEAAEGEEALERLGDETFDLVITDLTMPGMDGMELIRAMQSRPEHAGTPVMFLTTEREEKRVEEGRRAGAAGWIVKPFDPDQLLDVIERLLP